MFFTRKSNRPAGLPEEGRKEKLDTTPHHRTIGLQRPPSVQEMIQDALRVHAANLASAAGAESFEDADDFDVDDDPELRSPYEVDEELPKWEEKGQRAAALQHAEEKLLKAVPPQEPKPAADPPAPAVRPAS